MQEAVNTSGFDYTPLEDILEAEAAAANNLMAILDENMVTRIGQIAASGYNEDFTSTAKWRGEQVRIAKLVTQEREAKNTPFEGAANVKYPLITEAVLQFNARSYATIMNNGNIALAKVIGADPDGSKKRRAVRVSKDMSFQLTEEIDGWDAGMDQLLMAVPQDGLAFKKVYYNHITKKTASEFVQAKDLVVNNGTRDLKSCPRISQRMPIYHYEAIERVSIGEFDEKILDAFEKDDPSDTRVFIEQHCLFDVDGDGYPEPYIVTFDELSGLVARVVADFEIDGVSFDNEEDFNVVSIRKRDYFTKYECFASPNGDFYTPGFGSLLLEHNEGINSSLNALFDAAKLANSQSGFLAREFRVPSGVMKLSQGEFVKTDVPAMFLQQSVMQTPVREPSMVLFQLMGVLIESGQSIGSISDVLTGDAPANQPVGTTLSLVEQGMKVYNAIFKRIYRGLRNELRMIFLLNKKYRTNDQYQNVLDEEGASIDDYNTDNMDVVPAADPNMATDIQKRMRMQALMETMQLPFVNGVEIYKEYLLELGIEDPEKYIAPPPQGPSPDQLAELAVLEDKRKQTEIKRDKENRESRKSTAEVMEILQRISGEGGNLGTAMAEIGMIDQFDTKQAKLLQQIKEADNEKPVQNGQGLPSMEGKQPMAMGVPNGAGQIQQ